MKLIMETLDTGVRYHPKAALVFYEAEDNEGSPYVEYFDMDSSGYPINAHPLTEQEAKGLAKALDIEQQAAKAFLKSKGILPCNVLHINPAAEGSAVWYTKACSRKLYFSERLGLQNGIAKVPAMVWAATKHGLHVYALENSRKPTLKTTLCNAPFFNVYANANVCMGNVPVRISESASLEEFTAAWEGYFFNSYFSHLAGFNPVKGNLMLLWKRLLESGTAFPIEELIHSHSQLKDLIQ
jgi:PRTRC genetic system protein B